MKKSFLLFTTLIVSIVVSKNLENPSVGSAYKRNSIGSDQILKVDGQSNEFSRTERESKTYVLHNVTANKNGYDSPISKSSVLDTVTQRVSTLTKVVSQKF